MAKAAAHGGRPYNLSLVPICVCGRIYIPEPVTQTLPWPPFERFPTTSSAGCASAGLAELRVSFEPGLPLYPLSENPEQKGLELLTILFNLPHLCWIAARCCHFCFAPTYARVSSSPSQMQFEAEWLISGMLNIWVFITPPSLLFAHRWRATGRGVCSIRFIGATKTRSAANSALLIKTQKEGHHR
jgi:hypothetical protein